MGISITLTDIENMTVDQITKGIEIIKHCNGYKEYVDAKYTDRAPSDTSGYLADAVKPETEWIKPFVPVAPMEPELLPDPFSYNTESEPRQPNGVEVDSTGLPWDGRIHATTRAKNGDQSWRLRRGVDDAIVSAVTRELQQTMGMPISEPAPIPMTPPPAQLFAPVPPPPFVGTVDVPSVPINDTDVSSVSVGAAQTVSHSKTFADLMLQITRMFQAGILTKETIAGAAQGVGLPSIAMLASRPDLVQSVATTLGITL